MVYKLGGCLLVFFVVVIVAAYYYDFKSNPKEFKASINNTALKTSQIILVFIILGLLYLGIKSL